MKKVAAFFDCDGTLYSAQYGRGLIKYAQENGRKNTARMYYAANLMPYLLYKMKLTSHETYNRPITSRLAWLVKDYTLEEFDRVADWITMNWLIPTERAKVIQRLHSHQTQGHLIMFVSGQFLPSLVKLGKNYNVDHLVGTQMEVKNDRYTGRIIPPVITGDDKIDFTREYLSSRGLDIDWDASYAYADSFSDVGLLNMVGHPAAVSPDAKLLELAQKKNWEIIGEPK